MRNFIEEIENKICYSLESIRNRYPCKIIKIEHEADEHKKTQIYYQAVTKLNIKKMQLDDLLSDRLLIEKFHPTDCIRLGFLSAGEIIIKNSKSLDLSKKSYFDITKKMFYDLDEESYENDSE